MTENAGGVITLPRLIGLNIRRARIAAGLRQAALGAQMAELDPEFEAWRISQTIGHFEAGRRVPGSIELFVLARILLPTADVTTFFLPPPDLDPQIHSVLAPGGPVPLDEWTRGIVGVVPDVDSPPAPAEIPDPGDELAHMREVYSTGFFDPARRAQRRRTWTQLRIEDLMRQREQNLRAGKRRPGPTFVSDKNVTIRIPIWWGEEISLRLKAGEPYKARDSLEAEALTRAQLRIVNPDEGAAAGERDG